MIPSISELDFGKIITPSNFFRILLELKQRKICLQDAAIPESVDFNFYMFPSPEIR